METIIGIITITIIGFIVWKLVKRNKSSKTSGNGGGGRTNEDGGNNTDVDTKESA